MSEQPKPDAAPETTAEHPERRCRRCHGPNVTWVAPSPLWNQVMRGDDINGPEIFDGIVCPTCFAVIAEESGVAQLWRLDAERVDVPLKTVTPSGRIWDADAWMWREPATAGVGAPEPAGETTGQDETAKATGGVIRGPFAFVEPNSGCYLPPKIYTTEWERCREMPTRRCPVAGGCGDGPCIRFETEAVDVDENALEDDDEPVLPQKPRVGKKMAILPAAERDRLKDENVQMHVQLNRIRALHRQYRDVYATDETGDSCAHCNTFTDAWRVPWPCPTIQALDDPVFPAPDKETEPGYRPVLLDISRDETRHPRGADGRFVPKALEGEP